jgi:hypothetical protein
VETYRNPFEQSPTGSTELSTRFLSDFVGIQPSPDGNPMLGLLILCRHATRHSIASTRDVVRIYHHCNRIDVDIILIFHPHPLRYEKVFLRLILYLRHL